LKQKKKQNIYLVRTAPSPASYLILPNPNWNYLTQTAAFGHKNCQAEKRVNFLFEIFDLENCIFIILFLFFDFIFLPVILGHP